MERHTKRTLLSLICIACLTWTMNLGCPAAPSQERQREQNQPQDSGQERTNADTGSDQGPADQPLDRAQEPNADDGIPESNTKDNGIPEPRQEPTGTQDQTPDGVVDAGTPEASEPIAEQSPEPNVDSAPEKATTWQMPNCQKISGLVSVAASKDSGKTLLNPSRTWPGGIQYTYGVVALRTPNNLVALYGDTLYRSTDAGCNWTSFGKVGSGPLRLALGANDRVWAWSDNRDVLVRIDGTKITTLRSPTPNIHGLGTHPTDPQTIRIGAKGGILHETKDGGNLWRKLGTPAVTGSISITYRVTFDPKDLDHVIAGHTREGFHVSTNGGQSWTKASGLTQTLGGGVNGFNAVISPVNGQIVWAMGIDLKNTSGKGGGKHMYRSTDGGKSYTKIVTNLQSNDVYITNGPHMVAHPTDANKMHWAFGTCANGYGTNLYTYDANTQKLSWVNHPYPSFDEIAIVPQLPQLYYLGIQTNSSPFCPK